MHWKGKESAINQQITLTCQKKIMQDNRLKLEKPWAEVKEMLKEANMELTDEDLQYDENHPEEMLQRLASRLNKDEASVKAWIESVSHNDGLAG